MAKKQLTIEEKLQAALVPVEEQPYKVPENWCWVRLDNINEHKSIMLDPQNYQKDKFELYSVPSSADDYPEMIAGGKIGSSKQVVQKDDVLLCKINPHINRVWKVSQYTGNTLLASSEWIIVRNKDILSDYLMWCFRAPFFRKYMLSNVSGVGGSLMRAQPKYVKTYPIPLPSYVEQSRIVARIESFFAKLDEAKEKIQEVLDGADLRRAAILHQAFTGKLTEKWRRENGVSDGSWDKVPLGNVIELLSGQDFKPTDYNDAKKGIPYITGASNFDDGVIINRWTEKPTVIAKRDDILLVCKGSGYGKTIIADFEQAHIARQIMALRVKEGIINKYVLYFLMDKYDEIRNSGQGLIPGISRKVVLGMNIFKISMPEQQEIVRLLDNLLSREQSTVTACEEALTTIDTLKKSILAHAFRGELGTNDPAEPNAKELLKDILSA